MPQKTKENILLLLLGGSGERFNSRVPKQFVTMPQDTYPLFIRTLFSLTKTLIFKRIVLVVNSKYSEENEFREPLEKYKQIHNDPTIDIVMGASTRHNSFCNGAQKILSEFETGNLIVHDANRPYISENFCHRIHETLEKLSLENPCFIPVLPAVESLCQVEDSRISAYLPRNEVMSIQTPQLIFIPALHKAIQKKESMENSKDYTDEGSFMMQMGFPVFVFPGDPANKKITYSEDIS